MLLFRNIILSFLAGIAAAPCSAVVISSSGQICPSRKELYQICQSDPTRQTPAGNKFFNEPFEKQKDRCRFINGSLQMRDWPYPPLEEYLGLGHDGLVEGLKVEPLFKRLGKPPAPPVSKVSSSTIERPFCHRASASEAKQLLKKLADLNFKTVQIDFLKELESYCLAFKVGLEAYKRLQVGVKEAFVIPFGEINLVIMGRSEEPPAPTATTDSDGENFFETTEPFSAENKVRYTTVGYCKATEDPNRCADEYISEKWDNFEFAFKGGETRKIRAVPFSVHMDAMTQWAGRFSGITQVKVSFSDDGSFTFRVDPIDGRSEKLFLGVRDGAFTLETGETVCDPGQVEKRSVYLRMITYPDAMKWVWEELSLYLPSDFPATERVQTNGTELGCGMGKNYSQWAADTANLAKHFLWQGESATRVIKWIHSERRLWNLKGLGEPRSNQDLVYGALRKSREELPLVEGDSLEEQAITHIKAESKNKKDGAILNATIFFEDIPAAELWYYPKAVLGLRKDGQEFRSHILIRYEPVNPRLYQTNFLDRMEMVRASCGTRFPLLQEFLKGIYAYYVSSPLQQGDELAGRVFVAAMYNKLFGEKLKAIDQFGNISIDALTLPYPEFSEKYMKYFL